jgi:glycosyltransferase involved in cell wall biosynthesis
MPSIRKQKINRIPLKQTKELKVLQIVDSPHSAIKTLANQIVRHNRGKAIIQTVVFHPKRPDRMQIEQIQKLWPWCDIVDIQYWKSGSKIRELFPKLWDHKKKILTHYNPYNLHEEKWNDYEVVNVVNTFQKKELPNARLIPLAIDMDFFAFNKNNYTNDAIVNMSVSRIEGKKGIVEVAKACNELNYKFILVGRVSDSKYIEQVKIAGGKLLEFRNNVSELEVKNAYYQSAIHVCNSVNNFESGCYDEQTEILTDEGWKFFKNLHKKEKVATLNPKTNFLEYHLPYKYVVQDSKELYYLKNKNLSFSVTGNHNMWVSQPTKNKKRNRFFKKYEFIRADELPNNFKVKRNCLWSGSSLKDRNWFRFIAIYLAKGSLNQKSENEYFINIISNKSKQKKIIEYLLKDLKFKYEKNKNGFSIYDQIDLAKYLKQFGNESDRFVPEEILFASSEMIAEFLTWFSYGQIKQNKRNRIFYSNSKKLIDNLQECLIKIGKNGNIFIQNFTYTLKEINKNQENLIRRPTQIFMKSYVGKVYCVEVENHILLVRRNGKAMFCGNTMPILEAMACGTPVLTRNLGHVPDIFNGSNMRINESSCEDVESIKFHLKEMMIDRDYRINMRNKGRESIIDRTDKKRAEIYFDLYREVTKK